MTKIFFSLLINVLYALVLVPGALPYEHTQQLVEINSQLQLHGEYTDIEEINANNGIRGSIKRGNMAQSTADKPRQEYTG